MKGIYVINEDFGGRNIHVDALIESLRRFGHEIEEFILNQNKINEFVDFVSSYQPFFLIDTNSTGLIYGEAEGKQKLLCDIMGFLHISIFLDDPAFHFGPLFSARESSNFLIMLTDIKHADFIRSLGINNIFFLTPFVSKDIILEDYPEKDIEVVFPGPVINPNIISNQAYQTLGEKVFPIFIETAEFMFRNPEVNNIFAVEYVLSLFNYDYQQEFLKWRNENPQNYVSLLINANFYATAKKRWFLINFLDGMDLKIIGDFTGELKEGHEAIEVSSHQDVIDIYKRSYVSLLSFPHILPTSIGFTPLEVLASLSAPLIDYRATLPGFLALDQEVISYMPLDRLDIEEKLLFLLENKERAKEIAIAGKERLKRDYNSDIRASFLNELINNIYAQSISQNNNLV